VVLIAFFEGAIDGKALTPLPALSWAFLVVIVFKCAVAFTLRGRQSELGRVGGVLWPRGGAAGAFVQGRGRSWRRETGQDFTRVFFRLLCAISGNMACRFSFLGSPDVDVGLTYLALSLSPVPERILCKRFCFRGVSSGDFQFDLVDQVFSD